MVCVVNKIDSNATGLSFAEEECKGELPGVAGADAVWYGLEPNEYDDFGGEVTTVARKPISATRQNKKGVAVGLNADGGFNTDFTQNNITRLLQTFFFAAARQKAATQPLNGTAVPLTSAATADDSYNAASGLSVFRPSQLVLASGFALDANNGLKQISTVAAGKIVIGSNLENETPPSVAQLDAVGYQFGAGVVALTVSAALGTLTITGLVAATGTYTLSASNQPADGDTVTIGTTVYTFRTALSTGPTVGYEVLRGADQAASLANLKAAVNGAAGVGTLYSVGTVAHTQVTAEDTGATLVVTAIYAGTSGNAIATTEAGTNSSWGAATLATGAGGVGWEELGIIPGEWIFIGGDDVGTRFSTGTNAPGYARVHTVTDDVLTFNDPTWTPSAEAAGAKTLRVFFGTVLRNEDTRALITKRYVQFERTLGEDAAGTQSEYLIGGVGNELTLNVPQEDKLNIDLGFVFTDFAQRTGLEGLKVGTRVSAPGEAAYNTSSDVYRLRMNVVDPATLAPSALFGYLDSGTLTINNGVTPDKAVGVFGAFDVSTGNFEIGGEATAYFTDIAACAAIRANADVALSNILAARNAGLVFDIPLLTLGGGRINVEPDAPVKVPLTTAGAESVYGHTLLHVNFPYLPDVAMP